MEHLLLTALDESRHLVVLLGKDGRLLHANRAALRAADLDLDEASVHLFWQTPWCRSVDDTAQAEQAVRRALAGEPTRYEATFGAFQAGSVDLCVTPVRDATGTVATVLVEGHDIGEWKATERALRESEEKFSTAFRACPHPIGVTELSSGRLVEINGSFERTFGLSREQVLGRSTVELGMWADPRERDRFIASMRELGAVSEFPVSARHQSGRVLLTLFSAECVDFGGVPHAVTFVRDVTEQVNAERALRESEEKFSSAFRASPDPVAILDVEGSTLDHNESFARLLACDRADSLGVSVCELGVGQDPEEQEELLTALRQGGSLRDRPMLVRSRAGAAHHCLLSVEPIEIARRVRFVAILRDITERLNAERAKLELESQLREAQRLEALGTLAGGIAHDFNNILTAIVAFSDLIDMEAESPSAVRSNLIDMRQATARATDLVRQILTFCRRKKQERRPTRLATVTLEALSLLRSCLPATIQFDTHVDPRAPVVLADPSRIHQVLMNLGTNAAHAMKGMQGKLTVRLDCVVIDDDGAPGRPELRPGRYARLLVGDSGRGMDPAIQRNVFEPFFTTKGPGEGTGLGLTVVRGIVQEHDGHVFIDSRLGEGTTFTIFLQEHPSELDEAGVPSLELQRGRGERVLVVDDERMLCDSLALLLERLGYRVSKRCDPVEALELFARDPMSFDVVLADLTMPGMTGVELARAMLDLRPRARILLMTGFNAITSADAVRELGIQAMVPKPVSIESLTTILRKTLEASSPTAAQKPKPRVVTADHDPRALRTASPGCGRGTVRAPRR